MIQTTRRELDVPLETRSLAPMRAFVRDALSESGLGTRTARAMVIAIDEACSSIILNAKENGASGVLHLTIDVDPSRVKVHVSDTGNDYDMGDLSREELLREFTRAKKTELGTFLIRRIVDEFSYLFKKGFQSELTMIKFLYDRDADDKN